MPLTNAESAVATAVEQRAEALLADLRLHVDMPTGTGHTPGLDEARAIFQSRLSRLGAATELMPGGDRPAWLHGGGEVQAPPPTLIARHPAPGRPILLSGHLDTVHRPQSPFRVLSIAGDGRTATGPGCVDMKGGLVIAAAALEVLDELGVRPHWTFVLNSDEETGSYYSEGALRQEAARASAHGGVGLVFEPALPDGSLVIDRPGSGQFVLKAKGTAAHVGRDFAKGRSAILAVAQASLAAAALTDPATGAIVNIGIVEGGTATNVVPDRAKAWGNVRFRDPEAGRRLRGQLEDLASADASAGAQLRVLTSFNRPAKPTTPAVHDLAMHARSAAADLGQPMPFGSTGGVCDGNILQSEGLPTIDTLGVRGGGLHTPQEWIELPSLVERCQLVAVLIHRLWARDLA